MEVGNGLSYREETKVPFISRALVELRRQRAAARLAGFICDLDVSFLSHMTDLCSSGGYKPKICKKGIQELSAWPVFLPRNVAEFDTTAVRSVVEMELFWTRARDRVMTAEKMRPQSVSDQGTLRRRTVDCQIILRELFP